MTETERPHERLRRENKARERAARKLAGKRQCRCCERLIPGNIREISTKVEIEDGMMERRDYEPAPGFGYYHGICTLRCALRWANSHAPRPA